MKLLRIELGMKHSFEVGLSTLLEQLCRTLSAALLDSLSSLIIRLLIEQKNPMN